MVSIRTLLQVSPFQHSPLPCFYQVFLCFYKKNFLSLFFSLIKLTRKMVHFQSKTIFFLSNYCWSNLILVFCLYALVTTFFSSVIMKLRMNNLSFKWLPIWPLIKSSDITKEFMVWKLQAAVIFFFSLGKTKFQMDTFFIILSY